MSDIDDIVDTIQKELQNRGISKVMDEIAIAAEELGGILHYAANADAHGAIFEHLKGSLRGASYELNSAQRLVGSVDSALSEAIYRIRNS